LDDAEVRPSVAGGDLVDITLCGNTREAPRPSAEAIWRMWFDGGPDVPNLWAPLDTATREEWLAAAAGHIAHSPDSPTGGTYRLDGRYVTDSPGFFCALGEAVQGPGGYYGDCLFWLHDFVTFGGHGPRAPFTLVWHDADVARRHLAIEAERDLHAPDMFTLVVDQLRGDGVRVVLD
jgi:hypothetical protein